MSDFEPDWSSATTLCLPTADPRVRWGVAFERHGDRLAHVLFADGPAGLRPFARSVEGTDTQDWPDSPPMQQLDACPCSDQRQGLVGLGAAGTSHWSLAIESDAQGGLSFDVACRAKTPPAFVGSTYELVAPAAYRTQSQTGLTFDLPDGWQWNVRASQGDVQGRCRIVGRRLVIQPIKIPHAWPATIRWKYRLLGACGQHRAD